MAYGLKFCRNVYNAEVPLGRHGVTTEPRLQTHTVSFWKQAIPDCWIQDGGLFFGIWEEVSEAVDLHRERESEREFKLPSICTSLISKSNFAVTRKSLCTMFVISEDFVVWAVHIATSVLLSV